MAIMAIECIRQAELAAQESIEKAQHEAQVAENAAKQIANEFIDDAKETALMRMAKEKDRALKKAEEIIITAKNTAIIEADELKRKCADKQDIVTEKIMNMIV